MAQTYSTEYNNAYIVNPPGRNYAWGGAMRYIPFAYTQVLVGTAADTILLCKLPPMSKLIMIASAFWWTGFTATATLDLGWQAYKDPDGATQALSAGGLLTGLVLTTASTWSSGMLLTATPDDSKPVVNLKNFNSPGEITIYATIGVAAPGVGATLNGHFLINTA